MIVELNKQLYKLNKEFLITIDVGNNQMITAQYIKFNYPKQFISSGSLGAMGTSISYGIGASLANSEKLIVSVVGDGGCEMSLNDLKSINRYNLKNIKIIVINNNSLSMVNCLESLFYNDNFVATDNFDPLHFIKLLRTITLNRFILIIKKDLSYKLNTFLNYKGSSLLHVKVDKSFCFPLVAPGKGLDEIIITENDIKNIK